MARIKHPQPQLGRITDRIGGIEFVDGFAAVDLSDKPNLAAAYEMHGYTVVNEGTPFFDLTVPELRELAVIEGIDIPKNAKKADIVSAFIAAGSESD